MAADPVADGSAAPPFELLRIFQGIRLEEANTSEELVRAVCTCRSLNALQARDRVLSSTRHSMAHLGSHSGAASDAGSEPDEASSEFRATPSGDLDSEELDPDPMPDPFWDPTSDPTSEPPADTGGDRQALLGDRDDRDREALQLLPDDVRAGLERV